MAVSKLAPSTGANDFNVAVGGTHTSITFPKEYAAGAYTINISGADSTFDIYAYNASGALAGYTNTASFVADIGFIKMVILGQTAGTLLSFTYKTTYTSSNETDEPTAGPVATSVSVADLPSLNATTVLTGRNFATGATVQFTSANTAYTATSAKSVTRNSVTSLTITRPDNLPATYAPYSIVVTNPGVTPPIGSNSHILSNAITVGSSPVWSTSATLPAYTKGVAYSQTVTATDPDGGAITYSTVSASLPSGLSVTGSGNVISGTPTVLTSGSVTLRATDAGGNYTDRTFTVANVGANAPVWVTTTLPGAKNGTSYSQSLTVTDDSGSTPTITVNSGSLPTGITLSGTTLSGTPTSDATYSFTLRATDANGTYTDQAFAITVYTVGTWSTLYTGLGIATVNDLYGGYYNGYMWHGGGENNSTSTTTWNSQWTRVNVSTGVATVMAAGSERDEMSSIWCGSKFFVTGGYYHNSSPVYSDIAIYDSVTNTWSTSASPGFSWGVGRTGTDGTNVYFVASGQVGIMYRYNVAANTYTTLATGAWTGVSQGARMPYYNGVFYAIVSDGAASWRIHKYTVASNTWSATTVDIPRDYISTTFNYGDNYAWGCDINADGTYLYIYAYDALQQSSAPALTRSTGDTTKMEKILRYNIAANTWAKTSYSDNGFTGSATGTDGANAFYSLGGYRWTGSTYRTYNYNLRKIFLD